MANLVFAERPEARLGAPDLVEGRTMVRETTWRSHGPPYDAGPSGRQNRMGSRVDASIPMCSRSWR